MQKKKKEKQGQITKWGWGIVTNSPNDGLKYVFFIDTLNCFSSDGNRFVWLSFSPPGFLENNEM